MSQNIKEILRVLKRDLEKIYGEQLTALYLYGSYARGEGQAPNSDLDIMLVLRGQFDYWKTLAKSSELTAALSLKNDIVISRVLVSETEYKESKMPLFRNVRQEGVAV